MGIDLRKIEEERKLECCEMYKAFQILIIEKQLLEAIPTKLRIVLEYLLLKNKKTSSRTVLRKDEIPMSRCHFSTWISCHGRQETHIDAERLPGVSTTGFQ
ncbi:hypothetical protein R6Z07F_001660 [Ovis aries]